MRVIFTMLLLLSGIGISDGIYASNTEWQQHQDMLRTRIIAASNVSDSDKVLLAWEADLEPGWKTYWRSPGEAGLPVRIKVGDQEQELQYPVPERFELFGLVTYGYKNRVVLPFYVDRSDIGNSLNIEATFMVCKDICIPFDGHYELDKEISSLSIHDGRINDWMERVPSKAEKAGLKINNVRITGKKGHQRLVVDVEADTALSKANILAEGDGAFEFGTPSIRLIGNGTEARFVLPVMTMDKNLDIKGKRVRFTLIDSKGNAIDRTIDTSL